MRHARYGAAFVVTLHPDLAILGFTDDLGAKNCDYHGAGRSHR
jgi:hypothetical protein